MNPQTENKTRMTAPEAQAPVAVKMVKIRALQAIDLGDKTLSKDQEAEVTEEQAKEFCDKEFEGNYSFSGERTGAGSEERHKIKRAVRL